MQNNNPQNDHFELIKLCLNANSEELDIKEISKGVSNIVYLINSKIREKLVAKIYLHSELLENLNSRKKENYISQLLSENNLGPKLFFCNDNIRIEQFLDGRDILPSELRDESIMKRIAYKLGKIHSLKITSTIEKYFIEEIFNNKMMIDAFCENLNPEIYENLVDKEFVIKIKNLLDAKSEILNLCKDFIKVPSHNDIWVGNIFKTNEDIYFLDFQMTSYNFRGYDIGKLLIEPMYVRDSTGRNYIFDINNYPSVDNIRDFLKNYYLSYEDKFEIENEEISKWIDKFIFEVEIGILISGYYSCFLGIYLAKNKNFGIDFMQFAKDGYYIYESTKNRIKLTL